MPSELESRKPEIIEAAKSCITVMDLAKALKAPISFAGLANERFDLGLEWVRPNPKASPRVAQAVPKPVSGKAKPKKGDSDA